MAYSKAHYDLAHPKGPTRFHESLGLQCLGVSVHVFARGEGFDFFHNHREQEEIYFCLQGSADLKIAGDDPETVHLDAGDIVRVDAGTLRAIGNESADQGVVLIAGACPHPFPSGIEHHDVIADVLVICGKGSTGFTLPSYVKGTTKDTTQDNC